MKKTAWLALAFLPAFASSAFAVTISGTVKNVRPEKKAFYVEQSDNNVVRVNYTKKTKWPSKKLSDPMNLKGLLVRVNLNDQKEAVDVERL